MPIISHLGDIMKQKGLTYEELQHLSRVAPDTVARARDERIATCKLATLEKLALALDVDICRLFSCVHERERERESYPVDIYKENIHLHHPVGTGCFPFAACFPTGSAFRLPALTRPRAYPTPEVPPAGA